MACAATASFVFALIRSFACMDVPGRVFKRMYAIMFSLSNLHLHYIRIIKLTFEYKICFTMNKYQLIERMLFYLLKTSVPVIARAKHFHFNLPLTSAQT
jgi:hypothetical protein